MSFIAFINSLKSAAAKATDSPSAFLQVTGVLMFGISFLAVLTGWLFWPAYELKTPLLLFGVIAIVLIVVILQKGFALGVALVIIGTVVASEKFILTITSILRAEPKEVTEILKGYGQQPNPPQDVAKVVSEAINKELGGIKPEERKRIERILTTAELERIRVSLGQATIPLGNLVKGGKIYQDFLRQFQDAPYFQKDMALLQREGLITCPGKDLPACKATDLGHQVASLDKQIVLPQTLIKSEKEEKKKAGE